jgi:hypothetical protein
MAKHTTHTPSIGRGSYRESGNFLRRFFVVAGLFLSVLQTPTAAFAITGTATETANLAAPVVAGSITVEPSFQEIIINATEQEKRGSIRITNNNSEQVRVTLLATEIQQMDVQGNVILADKPTSPATALAKYVSFDTPDFALAPRESILVPFRILNTVDLSPGGHYSAIIARFAATEDGSTSVVPAISSFVIVHKTGGEQYHLSLSQVQIPNTWYTLPRQIVLRFNNQGNSHLTPRGLVEILDWGEHRVASGIINVDSMLVLPQSEREMSVPIRQQSWVWPIWVYTLKISGHASPSEIVFSQQTLLVIIHWPSLSVLLAGIGVSSILFIKVLRGRQRKKPA